MASGAPWPGPWSSGCRCVMMAGGNWTILGAGSIFTCTRGLRSFSAMSSWSNWSMSTSRDPVTRHVSPDTTRLLV